jgi:tetratricopeptide (TPR) repeat protein
MTPNEVLDAAERAIQQSDLDEAERLLTQAWPGMSKAPGDALHALAQVRLLQNRANEADALLSDAVRAEPHSLRHHIAWGHVLLGLGRHAEAASAYSRALEIDRKWPGLLLTFARAAYAAGRYPESERAAREALSQEQSAEAWNALSGALRAQGKAREALEAALSALHLDPIHAGALNSKGAALLALGNAQEALAVFDQIVGDGVQSPVLSLNRGTALMMLKRKAEAEAVFEEALRLWPDLPNLKQQVAQRRAQ